MAFGRGKGSGRGQGRGMGCGREGGRGQGKGRAGASGGGGGAGRRMANPPQTPGSSALPLSSGIVAPKDGQQGGMLECLGARARTIAARLGIGKGRTRELPLYVAVVDQSRCLGCGVCADTCPEGAIVVNHVARVIAGQCTGCGECLAACPQGAITADSVT